MRNLRKVLSYTLYFVLVLVLMSSLQDCSNKNTDLKKTEKVHELKYTETKINVFFNDGTNQIFDINIYDSEEINIENGNLSYWITTKKTGGIVAKKIHLASSVKYYTIINETQKTIVY